METKPLLANLTARGAVQGRDFSEDFKPQRIGDKHWLHVSSSSFSQLRRWVVSQE
jgi:hypothetical protein